MPWKVVKDHSDCGASKPFAVVSDKGKLSGCHATRQSALKQMALLYSKYKKGEIASEPPDFDAATWEEMMLAIESND
jgi:hypothetical protein